MLATLVVNAVDAIRGQGHIWVRTFTERKERGSQPVAVIEVGDSGAGMTSEVLAHAFEPFFTTKAPAVGTGLGLSSVHRLVTDSGGAIEVQSEAGRGTVFQVRLPVKPVEARPPRPGARPQ